MGAGAELLFSRAEQISPVPAARQRQRLSVGLVHHARSGQAVVKAERQRDLVRVNVDRLGLEVGAAKRARQVFVEHLPVAFLAVGKPQRVVVAVVVVATGQQAFGDFGAHRELDFGVGFVKSLRNHRVVQWVARCRLLVDCVGRADGQRQRAVAAHREGVAVGAALKFPKARQRRIFKVFTADGLAVRRFGVDCRQQQHRRGGQSGRRVGRRRRQCGRGRGGTAVGGGCGLRVGPGLKARQLRGWIAFLRLADLPALHRRILRDFCHRGTSGQRRRLGQRCRSQRCQRAEHCRQCSRGQGRPAGNGKVLWCHGVS